MPSPVTLNATVLFGVVPLRFTVMTYVAPPAVPAVKVPVWLPTDSEVSAAYAGAANPTLAAMTVAASKASRARVAANPEMNLFVVSTLISLACYWQLFGSGGSIRT